MNKILKFSELTEAQKKESIELMQNWQGWDDNYTVHISNRDLYKIVVTPDYEQSTLEFDHYELEFISDIENVLNQLNDLLLSRTSYEQLRFEVEQDAINEYSNMLLAEVDNNNNIIDVNLNC